MTHCNLLYILYRINN